LEVGRIVEVGRETVVGELVLMSVGLVESGVGRGVDVGTEGEEAEERDEEDEGEERRRRSTHRP